MFNKRYIFVLVLLIVAISALSAVSATDLNTTDEVIADEVSVDGQLEQTDDVSLEAGNGNNFTRLNQIISGVPEGYGAEPSAADRKGPGGIAGGGAGRL